MFVASVISQVSHPRRSRRVGNRLRAAFAALVTLLLGGAVAHAGTSTAALTVQVTITASCTINAATLNFGSSVAGTTVASSAVNGSTTVGVSCTNGSPYSIGMDNGANASGTQRRMANGANFLSYNLYVDALRANPWTTASSNNTCTTTNDCFLGTGTGAAQTVNVYGSIPSTGTAPAPGLYSDTVTMTITF